MDIAATLNQEKYYFRNQNRLLLESIYSDSDPHRCTSCVFSEMYDRFFVLMSYWMGWNNHMDDDNEISNLPPEAFSPFEGPFDPQNHWLSTADEDGQRIAMRAWFLDRYCDPAHETPYNGREGGYLFIYGGPYDPAEVLPERFTGIVNEDLIQEVIDEMHDEVGNQWAPVRRGADEYDDDYGVDVKEQNEPFRQLCSRLEQSEEVLKLEGSESAKLLAQKLVFVSVITAFESFLWETIVYWVDHDDAIIKNIVTKIEAFRDKEMKLGEIFQKQSSLKDDIKGYLQHIVWHDWRKVRPLFSDGLEITIPSFKKFDAPLLKRHDIVHRSGLTKVGWPIAVNAAEIQALCEQVREFAFVVDQALAERSR